MLVIPSLRHCSNKYKLAREGINKEKDKVFFFFVFLPLTIVTMFFFVFVCFISSKTMVNFRKGVVHF